MIKEKLTIFFNDGKLLYFHNVTDLTVSFGEVSFRYRNLIDDGQRVATFNRNNIAGYSVNEEALHNDKDNK